MQIEEIVLESSPFIRTMMTAAGIAKVLDLPKFHVNYLYSEIMSEHMFDANPLKKTILSSKSKDHIV